MRGAPLGLGCALSLYVLTLAFHAGLEYLDPPEPDLESSLVPRIEHALSAVRATMVELPDVADARMVAELAGNSRMARIENRQLVAKFNKIEDQYASLLERFEVRFSQQKEGMVQMQGALRRLQAASDGIQSRLKTLNERYDQAIQEHYKIDVRAIVVEKGRDTFISERISDEQPITAPVINDNFTADSASVRSSIFYTAPPLEAPATFAALQIARRLDNTRTQALISKRERTFTIDVENGLLMEGSEGELVQLDPGLELSLETARSEIINEKSGRIRFFADGSSTGGRIRLQNDKGGATVTVDWSTGAATVQVDGG
jgi:general secretion pathway protein H